MDCEVSALNVIANGATVNVVLALGMPSKSVFPAKA
jgi:hypothetical protein